jgi:REP element-mobilizing transposase RayT
VGARWALACVICFDFMAYYERNLPHWHPDGKALFITWRLHGSMPNSGWQVRKDARETFREMERILDVAKTGPLWLKDPRIATVVAEAFHFGGSTLKLYELVAYTIMANHVHFLIWPNTDAGKITKSIKGFTARESNKILNRTGEHFWQDESFDRWVRDQTELNRIIRYIENNSVAAGLAENIEDYPWSSARRK